MQYSLMNRFRGALLGSFVGEILGSVSCQGKVLGKATLTLPKGGDTQLNQMLSDWSQIATCGAESLIRHGRLDVEDWVLQVGRVHSPLLLLKTAASSHQAAIATLPMALFFHEDQVKLRQQLLQAAAVWQQDSEAFEGVLAVAYAIALALTEKLDVATLIPQTLAYLGTSQTPLVQQLEQVQTILQQGGALDTTLTQLRRDAQRRGNPSGCPNTSIALAFYCFLNTPEDFRLCVTRAALTRYQPQITTALTGALCGVYNSLTGIPVGWRLAATQTLAGVQRLQLADDLLAVWSGVYEVPATDQFPRLAVAAPHVIQPR
ncbi:MAG TPA: ADP-ribosylglycohydrolase family protein [Cyanobacteria bacterium UBA8553]|nr:ADP-ribosylglycohydrolase family protein [Cyanobacteria bacterium UBA8553]